MQTIIKVEGMSCGHCENHVKEELLEVAGVLAVEVSSEKGEATIEHDIAVELGALKEAICEAGYVAI